MRHSAGPLLAASALLLLGACGDDDDAPAASAEPVGAASATYCDVAAELNAIDAFPTDEQLARYEEVAPDEIQDELAVVIPGFLANADHPEAAFGDADFRAALDVISEFEIDTCGPEVAGDRPDDGAPSDDIDAELAAWCENQLALQDSDVPTEELLTEAEATAPDDIAGDVEVVVGAFREGLAAGDPGLGLVRDSYEHLIVINTFNDEHCGIPQDPGDFQDPAITTADPAAAQVAVTATEFAFELESPPAPGPTTFTMTNEGHLAHVMVILQAAEGHTAEEAFGAEDDAAVAGVFASYVAVPGDQAVVSVDLTPGEYMMFCYLPTVDGAPHLALGMTHPFTVS